MEFIKFPSLINSYQEKMVTKAQLLGITDWTVTEKIHGANMGLYCDGDTVRPASRNNLVDGTFFKCEPVINKYFTDVISIYNLLNTSKDAYIIIYGEYFGGIYDGKSLDQAKKVQKGIDYTPDNDFRAFNVLIVDNGDFTWIDTATLSSLLESNFMELKTTPILTTGSLSHCLNFKNEYNSEIPASYDLEPLDKNICEGNVIMPSNGSDYMEGEWFRGFKNKNSAWAEKASKPKPEFNITDSLSVQRDELITYATENRFQNVLSKEGEFNSKFIGKYIGLMLKDIYEEYLNDGFLLPEAKLDKKYLTVQLTTKVREIILKEME